METIRAGANFVTNERPTGDRYNSPSVTKTVNNINQNMLTGDPLTEYRLAAGTMTRKPDASRKQPTAIFDTADGSFRLLDCHAQKVTTIGVNRNMRAGLRDWNQDAGNSRPKTFRSV